MKAFKFIIVFAITVTLAISLSTKFKIAPPLGKFLNPTSGFWQNAVPATDIPALTLELPGLQAPVQITYDQYLIPHIFAQNNHDLYYAQGYVTATHRLWQMEFQTHFAGGRIAEIVGPAAQDLDRTSRRKGMVYAAQNSLQEMNKVSAIKESLEAYTAGVNYYISTLSADDYPFEYKLLDYAPEPWTPLKSSLLLKYMANDLNFHERDLQNTNALQIFGRETFDILFPDMENPVDAVVEKPGEWNFAAVKKDSVDTSTIDEVVSRKLVPQPNPDNGSNNWAVGPDRTASGNAILSSDPHLGLNLPSLWFVAQLQSPDVNVLGATLPGAPGVVIGYNDSIAWGATNAQRDLVDWYKIQFKDDTKAEYKLDDKWVKSAMKIEEIKIRGEESFYDTVYYTHFGPVMFDDKFHPDSEKKYYALRWIAHDPSNEILAFYKLNRANNHDEYMDALDNYSSPAQNFAFAAANGDIAMRVQGKYPNKAREEGKFLLDGTTTQHDWTFIPNEHNIMYTNPDRGFVASANQYPADSTYPYYIHAASYENYRNRRINGQLRAMEGATVQKMMKLQNDNYNLKAAESLGTFLDALDSMRMTAAEVAAFDKLADWDFYNNENSIGASYYERWWDILYPMIWDEMIDSKISMPYPSVYTTIKLLHENPDFALFDIATTPQKENAKSVLIKSFRQMAAEMAEVVENDENDENEVRWANFKDTYIKHLLRIEPLGTYHIPIGGNHGIINATSANHGPSWRMIVELDPDGPKAFGVYPGGQSGNPGSRFYDNFIESWALGNYLTLQLSEGAEGIKSPMARQTLKPPEK
jgi:penicillin G amidase